MYHLKDKHPNLSAFVFHDLSSAGIPSTSSSQTNCLNVPEVAMFFHSKLYHCAWYLFRLHVLSFLFYLPEQTVLILSLFLLCETISGSRVRCCFFHISQYSRLPSILAPIIPCNEYLFTFLSLLIHWEALKGNRIWDSTSGTPGNSTWYRKPLKKCLL